MLPLVGVIRRFCKVTCTHCVMLCAKPLQSVVASCLGSPTVKSHDRQPSLQYAANPLAKTIRVYGVDAIRRVSMTSRTVPFQNRGNELPSGRT